MGDIHIHRPIPGADLVCNEHKVRPDICFHIHHPDAFRDGTEEAERRYQEVIQSTLIPNTDGPIEVREPDIAPVAYVETVEVDPRTVQSIKVFHNVEMAHRLAKQPGTKCHNIHGHTWRVELELIGKIDSQGMVLGLEFGAVKKLWRGYLDETFDHHFLINYDDPMKRMKLEGVVLMPSSFGDPTVENVAKLWGMQAKSFWPEAFVSINLGEAAHNAATWKG